MNDQNPWTLLSSSVKYENKWMTVHEDQVLTPEGDEGIYGYVESKDSVMIVVLNPENEFYLIRTFSYPTKSWSWELPGGGGEGEDALLASQRELIEETGISANTWHKLGSTRVCNGLMTERLTTYLATDISFGERPASDDTGLIESGHFFTMDQIHQMIEDGEIDDGQSLTGLYLAERWLASRS